MKLKTFNSCIWLVSVLMLAIPFSTIAQLSAVATVVGTGATDGTGSITISDVTGGIEPYSYSWSSGEQTNSIHNKNRGQYTVTITDANAVTWTRTYMIGYQADWINRTNVSLTDGVLTSTTNGWNHGALTSNTLDNNVDGWIEFVVGENSTYTIGFSNDDNFNGNPPFTYSFGFQINETGRIFRIYEGFVDHVIGTIQPGDVFRIERTGSIITYWQNEVTLRTVPANPDSELRCKAAIHNSGATPLLSTSFDAKIYAVSNVLPTGVADGTGSIAITTMEGGAEPYTYGWSSGEQTTSINNKARGLYTFTITDADGRTFNRSYEIGYKVDWINLTNVSQLNGVLSSTTNGWNHGALSSNVLGLNTDGWFEFIVGTSNATYGVGFARNKTFDVNPYMTFAYGFVINESEGSYKIYEGNNHNFSSGIAAHGDVFRIERTGNTVTYSRNGEVLRSVTSGNTEWRIKATINNAGTTPVLSASFDAQVFLKASVASVNISTGTGAISITQIEGGTAPYTYSWPTGEQTASIMNKPQGIYVITVSDAENRSATRTYHIGQQVNWTDLTRVTNDNGVLTTTTPQSWSNGANSANILEPASDGWLEFVSGSTMNRYIIGFATYKDFHATIYGKYLHAFEIDERSGYYRIYEGSNIRLTGTLLEHDVFKIAREGTTLRYFRNGIEIRAVETGTGGERMVKAAIAQSGSTPNVIVSFETKLQAIASVTPTGTPDGTGAIEVVASGGTEPYTYSWSSGEQGNSINNKLRGEYTVTITDGDGRSLVRTYAIGYRQHWMDFKNVIELDGILTSETHGHDNGAASANVLMPNTAGWIEFVTDSDSFYAIGYSLGRTYGTNSPASFWYSLLINSQEGRFTIYHNNDHVGGGNFQKGDIFRIERNENGIVYKRNDTIIKSLNGGFTLELIPKVAILGRGNAPVLASSSVPQLFLSAVVKGTGTTDGTGTIDGTAEGGTAPYHYAWSNGEQTAVIDNKNRGVYTVTVTDSEQRVLTKSYSLGYRVNWDELVNVTDNEGVLVSSTSRWNHGAIAENSLSSNTDGWLEFVANGQSYYVIGFATDQTFGTSPFTTFRYSIMVNSERGSFQVREGTSNTPKAGSFRKGDVFRIERNGNTITYRQNDDIVRSVNASGASQDWFIKASINDIGYTPLITTSLAPAGPRIFYSIADGDWTSESVWSMSDSGPPSITYPTSDDSVVIRGHRIAIHSIVNCTAVNIIADDNTQLTVSGVGSELNVKQVISIKGNTQKASTVLVAEADGKINVEQ